MSKHIVCIHECRPLKRPKSRACHVRIAIDGTALAGVREISDPFPADGKDRHGWVAWYLEDGLNDWRFNEQKFNENPVYLDEYRIRLFDLLQLKDEVGKFKHSSIEINIFAYSDPDKQKADPTLYMSVLGFYWELLELIPTDEDQSTPNKKRDRKRRYRGSVNIWPAAVSRVFVRRVVLGKPFSNSNLMLRDVPKTVPWSELAERPADTECRVLLVIARRLARPGEYEISPSFIECALLRLFENLNEEIGRDFYQLEVVRPGSFTELEAHLATTARRPFHVVHFDMHGIVLCQKQDCGLPRSTWRLDKSEKSCRASGDGHFGRAFLIFAGISADGRLISSPHSAADIANLLQRNNIHCVALNACESARTNEGDNGNLSYTFLQHGVSNVVAMSFRISDWMFVKYYASFYRELFKHSNDVAEAASHARHSLQKDRERRDADNYSIHMDDWFVPVTYCNENIVKLPMPTSEGRLAAGNKKAHEERRRLSRARRTIQVLKAIGLTAVLACWTSVLLVCHRAYWSIALCLVLLSILTATLWYLMKLGGAALSLRYVRLPAATEIKEEVLDNNMLIIESVLKNKKPLVLHGLSSLSNAFSLIDSLAFVWRQTRFIDLVIVIPAAWFYQPEPVQMFRRWCCRLAHHAHCCHGEQSQAWHEHRPERTMFIVTDLEIMFPLQPTAQLNRLQVLLQSAAQQRFVNFLEKRFKDEDESNAKKALVVTTGGEKPYLFLSGSERLQGPETLRASLDQLKVHGIRSTTFTQVEEFVNRTEYIGGNIASA